MEMLLAFGLLWIIINCIGSILFILDKRKAVAQKHRISEKTLLTWAFLGAALSMFFVGRLIRHKTRTMKFRVWLPVFMLLHAGTAVFLYTSLH